MKIRLIILTLGVALISSSCDLGRNTRDEDYRPRWRDRDNRYYEEDRKPITQSTQGPMQPNNYYYYITPERKNDSNSSKVNQKRCEIEDIEFKNTPSINIRAIEASGTDYKAKSELLTKEIARLKKHIIELRIQTKEHIENSRKNCQY